MFQNVLYRYILSKNEQFTNNEYYDNQKKFTFSIKNI